VVLDYAVAALEEEEIVRKRWEREVLIPAHDELMANPSSGIPIDQVERNLEARRQRRLKAS
jgi:chorismate-pyruvate lyase